MNFKVFLFVFTFGVLAIGSYLAFHAPEYLIVLFPVLLIGAAVFVVLGVWRAIIKGELPGKFGRITYRQESPIGFWIQVATYISIAVFLFFNGLALLGLAPHWFIALLRSMHSHH
jgi:hypothetical protein